MAVGEQGVDDLESILVAIITSIGTLGAAAFGARRLSRRTAEGHGGAAGNAARWREQAELEKARADLLAAERDDAIGVLASERARLATTQHDLDDCSRQRDNAYSRIRALELAEPRRRQRSSE